MRMWFLMGLMALILVISAPGIAAELPTPVSPSNLNKASSDDMAAGDESPADNQASTPFGSTDNASMPLGHAGAGDTLANFGPSSGTVVGNRALELRDEVLRLRSSVNLNSDEFMLLRANGAAGAVQYHSTMAAITARLQNGTTRGNPILLRQWDEAEASLNEVTNSLARLNALQTAVAADSSLASYLLESVQAAFQLSGAVDEDHDQLKLLRDEVSRMVVQLDYLHNQVADDIQRQTAYLTTERSNLQALAFAISRGELLSGGSLANRQVIINQPSMATLPTDHPMSPAPGPYGASAPSPAPAPVAPVASAPPPAAAGVVGPAPMSPRAYMEESGASGPAVTTNPPSAGDMQSIGRLLVLIRFNQPNVDYDAQLAHAVSTALQRQPDAQFSVVAVSPAKGDPGSVASDQETAMRNAETVKRSLVQLGLAPARISMGNTQLAVATSPEVHVYIR